MIEIKKYLPVLCDPFTHHPLELEIDEEGTPSLTCKESGLRYLFIGDFPDLRPNAGIRLDGSHVDEVFSSRLARKHNEVMQHYHDKPCNNYMDLNNVPLGKWLQEPKYKPWFEDIKFAVEVGAGKGAIATAFKKYRGISLFCIDLAYGSLQHVRSAPLEADGALASNLLLPLHDEVADMVVSYGVIHHTPDQVKCFQELARILKPGGKLFLGVYNWENIYRSLYFFFSPPLKAIRKIFGQRLGDLLLMLTVFPPYHIALWLILIIVQHNYRFPSLRDSWEQFGDFFLTTYARFYMYEEMVSLANILGLRLVEYAPGGAPNNNFSHFYWFEKPLDQKKSNE